MFQNIIEVLILSVIQGVSEFLPVSSSAHLILVSSLYEFKSNSLLIDISLHLGSLLAIIYFFREELLDIKNNKRLLSLIVLGSIPLIVVGIVFQVSQGIIAWIDQGTGDFLKVNGQSTGIMTVVLFGSGTDYCLFISSRFKEELAKTKDKHDAMKKTMKGVGGAVTSAGFTIIVASSILLLCILKSYQSLGPVIGIAVFLMLIADFFLES